MRRGFRWNGGRRSSALRNKAFRRARPPAVRARARARDGGPGAPRGGRAGGDRRRREATSGEGALPRLRHAAAPSGGDGAPEEELAVIVQGNAGRTSSQVERRVERPVAGRVATVRQHFEFISGVSVQLTGARIRQLARLSAINAITPDAPIELASYSNRQKWAYVVRIERFWRDAVRTDVPTPPAIAIVDSGIEKGRIDFRSAARTGSRVIHEEVMTPLQSNSPGDGRGHGTFVAGIGAGSAPGYAGTLPSAPLVSST